MGMNQQKVHGLEEARAAGKSVMTNAHDTQSGGIKQNFKQNVTNAKVSGTVKAESGASGCCFGQRKTGSKKY